MEQTQFVNFDNLFASDKLYFERENRITIPNTIRKKIKNKRKAKSCDKCIAYKFGMCTLGFSQNNGIPVSICPKPKYRYEMKEALKNKNIK